MGKGDEEVGEDDGGVGVDCSDNDGLGGVPAPPEERGRGPPFFLFLDLLPRWEKGFPLVRGFHGMGGARAPSRLDLSICFCVPDSALSPFHKFPEICNSDWAEFWT